MDLEIIQNCRRGTKNSQAPVLGRSVEGFDTVIELRRLSPPMSPLRGRQDSIQERRFLERCPGTMPFIEKMVAQISALGDLPSKDSGVRTV